MSLKSLIQIIIILIITIILGGVYFNYFANNNKISLESSEKNIETQVEENQSKKKEAKVLNEEPVDKTKINENEEVKELKNEEVKEVKNEIINLEKSRCDFKKN